jgi:hypothetical protein
MGYDVRLPARSLLAVEIAFGASLEGPEMRINIRTVTIILGSIPLFFAAMAMGGEGVQVKITNDGTEDIVVTVYDMNTRPQRVVVENARINGFASIPINVIGDSTGRATVSWTATSIDRNSPACGHDESVELGDSSSLRVHADSSCT